jgi:hypothetical protein
MENDKRDIMTKIAANWIISGNAGLSSLCSQINKVEEIADDIIRRSPKGEDSSEKPVFSFPENVKFFPLNNLPEDFDKALEKARKQMMKEIGDMLIDKFEGDDVHKRPTT